MADLQGKTILITGASAGIGAATAIECARAGMNVALAARRADLLEKVAHRVRQQGGKALPITCDVRDDAQVQAAVDQTLATFGSLESVFANAGYGLYRSVETITPRQQHEIFETNLFGSVRLIQAAMPHFRKHGRGHVLICSSACSEIGLPMYGFYAATKAAQDAIAGAMRAELHGSGIHVSSVHPIGTRSEFFDVVARVSNNPSAGYNTPSSLMHSCEKVARCVVRCLRRPKAEVWPSVGARLGLALTTALPFLGCWSMNRLMRTRYESAACASPDDAGTEDASASVAEQTRSG